MSVLKKKLNHTVFEATKARITTTFDEFERIYVSFSAGKDSTVMLHMVVDEAKKRGRKIGVLIIDLEAQYETTMNHCKAIVDKYSENIELFWVCLPLALRNAVSVFEPRWKCWDVEKKDLWVREKPSWAIGDVNYFPFFRDGMEFEEFVPEFHKWYSQGKLTACMVGIRADESLNRFRAIAGKKEKFKNYCWTTKVEANCYNIYPIYDWRVSDIWVFHAKNPEKKYNEIYNYMYKAGLTPAQMRICQPYGDDQRKGLWLYHILEPKKWSKVMTRVSGVNSGALFSEETGNINGVNRITKPDNHTWKSFCNLLLATLPKSTSDHYIVKFRTFIKWWSKRGYKKGIPDEAPPVLEAKRIAPSYRRLCKVILRNDWWCKSLAFSQPKSEAYGQFLRLKKLK